jgi:hypothetical protein
MAKSVTISRRDAVELIEQAALKLTGGNKTEAVVLALRRLLDQDARAGDLFGAHKGGVRVGRGLDLPGPALDVGPGAQTGKELKYLACPSAVVHQIC